MRCVPSVPLILSLILALAAPLYAQEAPSALDCPNQLIAFDDYRLPPKVDPAILSDRPTEIWGRLYYPTQAPPGPLHLVIFLHGNYPTCRTIEEATGTITDVSFEYTTTGRCTGAAPLPGLPPIPP